MKTIADYTRPDAPLVAGAVHALAEVDDRGVWFEEQFTPWSEGVAAIARRVTALRGILPAGRPPHVGVLLENTPEYLWLLGAAATSEIVVAGLNSTRRGESLARDVRRADCALVITDAAHAHLLDGGDLGGARVVRVDSPEWAQRLDAARGAELPALAGVPVGADDLVVLVYTSGTSGDPKAVRVTQAKVSVPGLMLTERFGIGAADCVYSAMPLFHSNAVMVAWPMAVFAQCSIALRRRFSASGWLADVRRYGCTFANYVGTPLSYILATPERDDDADNPVRVVYGNEAGARVRAEFTRRFAVQVVDGFGSTEGGVSVSRTPETPDDALGPLQPGTLVVDPETGQPCPPAEFDADGSLRNPGECVGELVADGPGLFAGYYRDPDADAERMRCGRFHTGDLAYVDADGYAYFAGRSSGWMRVDGENLAAAPIERVLARHPQVREVSVYALQAASGVGDRVAAALVVDPGADVDEVVSGLGGPAGFLAGQPDLGPKQWPSVVRVCAELPRTASFKVVARELARRGTDAGGASGEAASSPGAAPGGSSAEAGASTAPGGSSTGAGGSPAGAADRVWLREGQPPGDFTPLS